MKKTLIYASAAFLLFGTSCKETLTPVIAPIVDTASSDSTYTGDIETPQTRNVLIEEFTGVQCPNCPQGAAIIETMMQSNSNIVSISYHASTSSTAPFNRPIPGASTQEFKTKDAELLVKLLWDGGVDIKPTASFDRAALNVGSKYFFKETWPGAYTTDIQTYTDKAPVNVYLESKFNTISNRYDIKATVKYTAATTTKYELNLYLTEDGIIDAQEQPSTAIDTTYQFHHTFRKCITTPGVGKTILPDVTTKDAGTVYIYKTSFAIYPDSPTYSGTNFKAVEGMWNQDNMKVTAIIVDPTDKRVVQAIQTNLKGG